MNAMPKVLAWAVVAAMVVLLLSSPDQVHVNASEIASADGFTLLTGQSRDPRASGGQELVYVIDHRSGVLLVYGLDRLDAGLQPVLLDGGPISALFGETAAPSSPPAAAP